MVSLIGLGIVVGTISVVTLTEPHWYAIALLAAYPPCVLIGWTLRSRATSKFPLH
jgi:hypothetical protein